MAHKDDNDIPDFDEYGNNYGNDKGATEQLFAYN
jgi:hypothetical protein